MAKNEVGEFDETDANNTDIQSISLAENVMRAPAVNNAFRATMGALKRWFKTSLFRLRDSTDQTKLMALDLSLLTTGTTRTFIVPDKNGTIALTSETPQLNGLIVSNNAADATNDLDITSGSASDIANTQVMSLAATITKRLDAVWAVGTNQGGLDTGTKANSTWYFVFVIKRIDTGVVDVLFSTSPTAPVMPTNYTVKRRIGAFVTSGAGAILAFKQNGGWFHYVSAFEMAAGTVALATNVAQSIYIEMPIGIKVLADFVFLAQADTVASFLSICDPDLGAAGTFDMVAALNTTTLHVAQMQCFTDTLGKVSAMNNANGTFRVFVRGWFDARDI